MLILFFVKTVILHFRKSTKKVLKLVELISNYISRENKKKKLKNKTKTVIKENTVLSQEVIVQMAGNRISDS